MSTPAATTDASEPLHFAGSVMDHYRHVCAFFDDADQEHDVMDSYLVALTSRAVAAHQESARHHRRPPPSAIAAPRATALSV